MTQWRTPTDLTRIHSVVVVVGRCPRWLTLEKNHAARPSLLTCKWQQRAPQQRHRRHYHDIHTHKQTKQTWATDWSTRPWRFMLMSLLRNDNHHRRTNGVGMYFPMAKVHAVWRVWNLFLLVDRTFESSLYISDVAIDGLLTTWHPERALNHRGSTTKTTSFGN